MQKRTCGIFRDIERNGGIKWQKNLNTQRQRNSEN